MNTTPARTSRPGGRLRRRGPLVALAAVMAVAAAACVEEPPVPPTVGAAISVSPSTDGVAPGTAVVVTGTGFNPAGNLGTRLPFFNQPAGVYVVFARIGDPWKPSQGGARQVIDQVWALPAAQAATLDPDGSNPEVVTMDADGGFTADLVLTEAAGTGDYAIITYAGSGAINTGEELSIPVSFSAPA